MTNEYIKKLERLKLIKDVLADLVLTYRYAESSTNTDEFNNYINSGLTLVGQECLRLVADNEVCK